MNDFLFYALLVALLYYFFVYRPQKKASHPILTQSQSTQTEPTLNELTTDQLPSAQFVPDPDEVKQLQQDIQQKDKQIKELQSQIRELAKRPLKPTNSKSTQTDELTATLDNLIKDIQELNNEL